jgi:hypothetical protein
MIELSYFIARLQNNASAIPALVQGVPEEQARWRPDAHAWSMLEVINHLYDEEREDFRTRFRLLLTQPDQPWPPIDPQGWVTSRDYNTRSWPLSIANWINERHVSLAWLRSLQNPQWDNSAQAPWGGLMHAGDILAAWLAHDCLHLRQLVELHYVYTAQQAQPYIVDYAGEW